MFKQPNPSKHTVVCSIQSMMWMLLKLKESSDHGINFALKMQHI